MALSVRPHRPQDEGVTVLEDDPLFNAGRGAVFTADRRHELDASIRLAHALGGGYAQQSEGDHHG